ncbi:unnamed protein product [Coffea canephora]|uniref:Myb/SANT-like domain-containing protein n=1 Tax=Coffea canephora TaxID=49390 RepID=A0A068UF01_COFCA|nr:unnamed protein product [Coffea canephora]
MLKEIQKGNKPFTTFTKTGWNNIEAGFKEKTGKRYSHPQFRNKFNQMRIRYFDFCMLSKEPGFTLDPALGKLDATDDVWKSAIKANKKTKRFRRRGCPLYNELGVIYGEPVGKSTNVSQVAQCSLDTDVKCLEDQSTNASPSESVRGSSDNEDYPSRSVRQRCQKLPSLRNEVQEVKDLRLIVDGGALEPTQIIVPSSTANKKHTDVAYLQTPATNHVGTLPSSSPFSITNCVRCLESIQGIDATTYLKAIKMFKDVDWREMFMAMSAERRLDWLASLD